MKIKFILENLEMMKKIKGIKNMLLAITMILVIACEADDSGTEDTAPRFSFRISGDGFSRTFTQEDALENLQLNLKHDADYDFIFSGGDAQGAMRIQMQYPTNHIEFITQDEFPPAPWEQSFASDFLSAVLFWEGDINNPITGNILNGTLRPNGEFVATELYFRVEGFEDASTSSNLVEGTLQIFIGDHSTEVLTINN